MFFFYNLPALHFFAVMPPPLARPATLLLLALLLPAAAGAPRGVGVLYNLNTVPAAQAQAAVQRAAADHGAGHSL